MTKRCTSRKLFTSPAATALRNRFARRAEARSLNCCCGGELERDFDENFRARIIDAVFEEAIADRIVDEIGPVGRQHHDRAARVEFVDGVEEHAVLREVPFFHVFAAARHQDRFDVVEQQHGALTRRP